MLGHEVALSGFAVVKPISCPGSASQAEEAFSALGAAEMQLSACRASELHRAPPAGAVQTAPQKFTFLY